MGRHRAAATRWLLVVALLSTVLAPAQAASAAARLPVSNASAVHPLDGLAVGSTAMVQANGDGLRLRATASLTGTVIATLTDGMTVAVLDGRVNADGYWWQRVQSGPLSGWAAEQYLRAAPAQTTMPTAGCASSPPSTIATSAVPPTAVTTAPAVATATPAAPAPPPPAFTGSVPASGGAGLVVWGGGPTSAVSTAATATGCQLRSVWTTQDDGSFLGYLFGAPDFVNTGWATHFGDNIQSGTPLLVLCGGPSTSAITLSSSLDTIIPAPWAPAPVQSRVAVPPTTAATAALVLDGSSGAVLYQKNGHEPLPPASLTKIATAILAFEKGNLDAWVPVDVDSRTMTDSSIMGLQPGDCFRLRDLLYGLILPSGNDAALAIGRYEAGSDDAFVASMNMLLTRLGLHDSHFVNAHGLSAPGHVASAYDLAMLARYAMTLPDFATTVRTANWTAQGNRTIALSNVNTWLTRYPGADGVKTGFTEEAGRTLVASVMRNGRRVFVVIMNSSQRDDDAAALFDWVFNSFVFP